MKKLLSIIIILLFITGCADEVRSGDLSSLPDETKKIEEPLVAELSIDKITPSKIEEKELFEQDGVKIIATSLNYDVYGSVQLNMVIENHNDFDIKVDDLDFSVNDVEMKCTFIEYIKPTTTVEAHLSISKDDMMRSLISTIDKIEMTIIVYRDNKKFIIENNLVIETDAEDYVQPIKSYGNLVYDENGIRLFLYKDGSKLYTNLYNTSINDVELEITDLKVNDMIIDNYTYLSVARMGKQRLTQIELSSEWNSEDIKKVNFKVNVYKKDARALASEDEIVEPLYTTEPLVITFNEEGTSEIEVDYSSYREINSIFG